MTDIYTGMVQLYVCPKGIVHLPSLILAGQNVLRVLANIIQTTSGDQKIPIVSTHATAIWFDEGNLYTESDETFT